MSRNRPGQDRPVLTGRAARRADQRYESRNTVRDLRATIAAKPSAPTWAVQSKDKETDRRRRIYTGPRVMNHRDRALIAYSNAGSDDYLLARDYLRALGCNEAFIASFESWFGRKTAEQFRVNHRRDPDNGHRMFVNGRIRRVNRYRNVNDLRLGALAYGRTRHLIPAFGAAVNRDLVLASA